MLAYVASLLVGFVPLSGAVALVNSRPANVSANLLQLALADVLMEKSLKLPLLVPRRVNIYIRKTLLAVVS